MLLVRTYIAPSVIHGIGLFAADPIPKGAEIWRFKEDFDLSLSRAFVDTLAGPAREQCLVYAYRNLRTDAYILCSDDARFFNHSETPNCIESPTRTDREGVDIAACDISAGEELTSDYRTFDADFEYKMRF